MEFHDFPVKCAFPRRTLRMINIPKEILMISRGPISRNHENPTFSVKFHFLMQKAISLAFSLFNEIYGNFMKNCVSAKLGASQKWVQPGVSLVFWGGAARGAKIMKFCGFYVIFMEFHTTPGLLRNEKAGSPYSCAVKPVFAFRWNSSNSYGIHKGNPSKSLVSAKTLESGRNHEIPWNFMKFHENSWNIMKFHEISWKFTEFHARRPSGTLNT